MAATAAGEKIGRACRALSDVARTKRHSMFPTPSTGFIQRKALLRIYHKDDLHALFLRHSASTAQVK